MEQATTKKDYLQFLEDILAYYNEDFPIRIVERETFTRITPLKILVTGNICRWAAVEAIMYELTGDEGYLQRAHPLLQAVVKAIEHTPRAVWDFVPYETPEGMERNREAYQRIPEDARWHGRPWWHVGAFAYPLPLALACQSLGHTAGWQSSEHQQATEAALAQLVDYHVCGASHYTWARGAVHNIATTMARSILVAALLIPDHPHAEGWRQWGMETFESNSNQLSPEDSAGYEAGWFYALLTMMDLLDKGQEAYRLAYHRAYFEHFKAIVCPSGACAAYGDCGDYGNAALLPILEKGATVFQDGTYKYAAQQHFRAIQSLPMEERSLYLQTTRWFDAYRWADDTVEPIPPEAGGTITHKGMVILRSGSCPDQAYLALSSREGGSHGHFDANAIAHFALGESELLRDGRYQWRPAFFHNRLLWRAGKPPGTVLDYVRPTESPWHPSPDGSRVVFATQGPAEGVENHWHPSAQQLMSVRFLAEFPSFGAVRTVLGPQQRTTVMQAGGGCLFFDYLVAPEMTTAVCLYYVPEILEQGVGWVRGRGMPQDAAYDLLIASLDPQELSTAPQERRNATEYVVYSTKIGAFPQGAWLLTALWPQHKQTSPLEPEELLQQHTITDGAGTAQVVVIGQQAHPITLVCRGEQQPGLLRYQPVDPDDPCPCTLQTDADMLHIEPADQGAKVTMVNGTLLEVDGKKEIGLPYKASKQTVIGLQPTT